MMKPLLYLALLPFLLASCTYYYPVHNASGSAIQFQLPADKYTILGPAEGESCSSYWLGGSSFMLGGGGIPASGATTYQEAVKAAVKAKNGDHFIQITTDFREVSYILYHEYCVYVYGQVVKLK